MGLILSISTLWNFKFGKMRLLSVIRYCLIDTPYWPSWPCPEILTFSLKSRQILSYHIWKVWLILPFYFFAHYFTYFSFVSGKTKVQKCVNSSIKIGHCKNHQRRLENAKIANIFGQNDTLHLWLKKIAENTYLLLQVVYIGGVLTCKWSAVALLVCSTNVASREGQ
jgi:hypothetical protein